MANNKKIPKFIIVGIPVVVVVIGLIVAFVYMPLLSETSKIQAELRTKQGELETVKTKVRTLMKLKDEVEKIQEELKVTEAFIPAGADIPGIIRHVDQFKEASGVDVLKLEFIKAPPASPGAPPANSMIAQIPNINQDKCSLTITGSYSQVIKFFEAVENSTRLFTVSNARFYPENEGQIIKIDLTMVYFYRNAPPSNPENPPAAPAAVNP